MKAIHLFAALLLCSCQHTQTKPQPDVVRPSVSGDIDRNDKVGKLNRKAQDDATELRRIDVQSKTTLEQLDDKIVRLLER